MPINNLLIDFDHTLFNTAQIKYEWASIMEKCGVPNQIFWRTYPQARYDDLGRPCYNPKNHVRLLKDYLRCPPEEIFHQIEETEKRGHEFLFPGALNFLNRMVSLNVPMTLILHGDNEYEREKIKDTGIIDFFNKVHYTDRNRQQIVEDLKITPQEKTYWISHSLGDMVRVKEQFPHINPIIKRRSEVPLSHYRQIGFLNFDAFPEMQEYLTIIHATSY